VKGIGRDLFYSSISMFARRSQRLESGWHALSSRCEPRTGVWFRPVPHTHTHTHYKNQIIIYDAISPNEPHQCILTHINNCNFNKDRTVCSLMMVFSHRNM